MTGLEHFQAIEWASKQPSPFALKEVSEFATYEFGQPRPEGTWMERFEKWQAMREKKNNEREMGN